MAFVDLHLHTTFSDGIVTPAELVKIAAAHGIGTLAVTDHDNIGGLDEAFTAAKEAGIKIISGVEISTNWYGKMVHFTVLGFDRQDKAFISFLDRQIAKRKEYFVNKVDTVAPGLTDEFLAENNTFFNTVKTKEFLVKKGIFPDLEAAGQALRAVVAKDAFVSPEEMIEAAHRAGALAILAHPFAPKISLKNIDPAPERLKKLVAELVAQKMDGIECYQASHSEDDTKFALEIAGENGLLVSGGCDWHGPIEAFQADMLSYIPYYSPFPGGLKTPAAAVAPLLERLGVSVDRV